MWPPHCRSQSQDLIQFWPQEGLYRLGSSSLLVAINLTNGRKHEGQCNLKKRCRVGGISFQWVLSLADTTEDMESPKTFLSHPHCVVTALRQMPLIVTRWLQGSGHLIQTPQSQRTHSPSLSGAESPFLKVH